MLCGWGVKAGMACLQVKLCVEKLSALENAILKALYKCRGLLLLFLLLLYQTAEQIELGFGTEAILDLFYTLCYNEIRISPNKDTSFWTFVPTLNLADSFCYFASARRPSQVASVCQFSSTVASLSH